MTDLSPVFAGLQGVMLPYAEHLVRIVDDKGEVYLGTGHIQGRSCFTFGHLGSQGGLCQSYEHSV